MGETATCRECGGQHWLIDADSVRCVGCGALHALSSGVPSTEVMRMVNDPDYGTMRVSSEKPGG